MNISAVEPLSLKNHADKKAMIETGTNTFAGSCLLFLIEKKYAGKKPRASPIPETIVSIEDKKQCVVAIHFDCGATFQHLVVGLKEIIRSISRIC